MVDVVPFDLSALQTARSRAALAAWLRAAAATIEAGSEPEPTALVLVLLAAEPGGGAEVIRTPGSGRREVIREACALSGFLRRSSRRDHSGG